MNGLRALALALVLGCAGLAYALAALTPAETCATSHVTLGDVSATAHVCVDAAQAARLKAAFPNFGK